MFLCAPIRLTLVLHRYLTPLGTVVALHFIVMLPSLLLYND